MPAFCTKCGTALGEGATFCTNCGTPTSTAAAAPAAAAAAPPAGATRPATPTTAPATGMSSGVKIALMIVGGFLLLGVLLAVVVTIGVWRVARNVVVDESAGKVTIKTEKGSLVVGQTPKITEAQLGIPIYPGAESTEGGVSFESEQGSMQTFVFKTKDSISQVTEFYKSRLGDKAENTVTSSDSALFTLKKYGGSDYLIAIAADSGESETVITVTRTRKGSAPGQ